jgi:hypothetical protein
MRGKTKETDVRKLLLNTPSLLASVDLIRYKNTEAYCNLDMIDVKYSIYKQSSEDI